MKLYEERAPMRDEFKGGSWYHRGKKRQSWSALVICLLIGLSYLEIYLYQNYDNGMISYMSRQLSMGCTHTPYILMDDVLSTMPIPSQRMDPPSHIQLCQAYLERSQNNSDLNKINERFDSYLVHEDVNICFDWFSTHESLLTIFSSSLVAAVGKSLGLQYQHGCHKHLSATHNDPGRIYDYTPTQMLLPENLIATLDAEKIENEVISLLCNRCIAEHRARDVNNIIASKQAHHCLLFPGGNGAESLIEHGKQLPIASTISSIVDRLRHMSIDWLPTTDPIEFEEKSGIVITLDEASSFMNYEVYESVLPPLVTSVQIFASSACAIAYAEGRSDCIEHGRRLKKYFITSSSVTNAYVRYDIVASTAAMFARMIDSSVLICPPGTVICLLPALAKRAGTRAFIAEDPSSTETYHWFEKEMLEERIKLRLHTVGYDAVDESDYINLLQSVNLEMPLDAIGEVETARQGNADGSKELEREEVENKVELEQVERDSYILPSASVIDEIDRTNRVIENPIAIPTEDEAFRGQVQSIEEAFFEEAEVVQEPKSKESETEERESKILPPLT